MTNEQLDKIAMGFDEAIESRNPSKIVNQIKSAKKELRSCSGLAAARLHYYIATAYAELDFRDAADRTDKIHKQLRHYRESLDALSTVKPKDQSNVYIITNAQVLTNYGNLLKKCGRFVAAIDSYQKAIQICPLHAMTHGTLGLLYHSYGRVALYQDDKAYFYSSAYEHLHIALNLKDSNVYPNAENAFRKCYECYSDEILEQIHYDTDVNETAGYKTKSEGEYRDWALQNGLFLNELSDLADVCTWMAEDNLHLGKIIDNGQYPPTCYGMFNQIKQEYTYARYLLHEALKLRDRRTPHYADRKVFMVNTLDYPCYGLRIEHLRTAFLTLYSLFDRIAFLLNEYFRIGIKPNDISFENIWKERIGNPQQNGYEFTNPLCIEENPSIYALHWIHYDMTCQSSASNPHLPRMMKLRHALIHRYTKVINASIVDLKQIEKAEIDTSAFYVTDEELESYTLELMKIIREAVMYTLFSIRIEEAKRKEDIHDAQIIECTLDTYDDRWKL